MVIVAGGCFFTEVVNEAPVAGIRTLKDGPHFIGETLRFNATKTVDDVANSLTCEWTAFRCESDSLPCTSLVDRMLGDVDDAFEVPIEGHDRIQIQLRVTDELGATRLQPDLLTVDIRNRFPEVEVQVNGDTEGSTGAYILSRPINLVIDVGDGELGFDEDDDPVTYTWSVLSPTGSAVTEVDGPGFERVGDQGYRLTPDVSGMWEVTVTAADEFGGENTWRETIFVGVDSPPCLQSLDPTPDPVGFYLVESTDRPRAFSVLSVFDVLDPFPGPVVETAGIGESTFRWFLQEPGASTFIEIPDYTAESYTIDPLAYEPGDLLELRVEVADRVRGPERVLGCGDDSRACELVAGSTCYQRQTWGVQIQ
tara:strand:+ start:49882 stop:50982 length:1101 start_codon:yes stop_codon:yes gene_type:complete